MPQESSDINQIMLELIKQITGTFTTTQSRSVELQNQSIEKLNALVEAINRLVTMASAHPSRADLLSSLVKALQDEMRAHDQGCARRSDEDVTDHHGRMEQFITLKLAPIETKQTTMETAQVAALAAFTEAVKTVKGSVEKIEAKANYILIGGGVLALLGPLIWMLASWATTGKPK